jgi:glycosyltransferase involved in cell wall biosynthesis
MYNVEPYLVACIESVLNQSMKEFELILVDDGSPDHCGSIADSYASRDPRVRVIHKKNGGVSAARNDGLKESTGDYVFLLDSDDVLAPDALNNMLEATCNGSYDVVLCDYATFSENPYDPSARYQVANHPFGSKNREVLEGVQLAIFNMGPADIEVGEIKIQRGLGAAWHYLFRRSLIEDNKIQFKPELKGLFDDGCFCLEVLEHAKSIAYTQVITYFYRYVETSITRKFGGSPFSRYSNVYRTLERYIVKYNKDVRFQHALCLRKFIYLNKSMQTFFFHPSNPASETERYQELLQIVKSPEYAESFNEIDSKALGSNRSRILLIALRIRAYRIYWFLKKLSTSR